MDHTDLLLRVFPNLKCGWSPFEGMTFPGSVAAVFVRGKQIEA